MKKTINYRYETDPQNNLVVKGRFSRGGVKKFRRVLDGHFSCDCGNSLSYMIKRCTSDGIPQQINFKGQWLLGPEGGLSFLVNRKKEYPLKLGFTLSGMDKDSLTFTLKKRPGSIRTMNLTGAWSADSKNRLVFCVEKRKGPPDRLVLGGSWNIDKNLFISYEGGLRRLKTKEDKIRAFKLRGRWQPLSKKAIEYALEPDFSKKIKFRSCLSEISFSGRIPGPAIRYCITSTRRARLSSKRKVEFSLDLGKKGKAMRFFVRPAAVGIKKDIQLKARVLSIEALTGKTQRLSFKSKLRKGAGQSYIGLSRRGKEVLFEAGKGFLW